MWREPEGTGHSDLTDTDDGHFGPAVTGRSLDALNDLLLAMHRARLDAATRKPLCRPFNSSALEGWNSARKSLQGQSGYEWRLFPR